MNATRNTEKIFNTALKDLELNYNEPVDKRYFYYLKFILGSLYIWKLLSRNFSNFGEWPVTVISGYPIDIYPPDYMLITAVPILFDLVTFHFIHFFIPWPQGDTLELVQIAAVLSALVFIFSSEKYTRLSAIIFFILVSYLWGFVFRLGQDIDAVFLLQGCLLMFAVTPLTKIKDYYKNIRFLVFVIFVLYYFTSGFNKVIDLSYAEWAKYDLVEINISKAQASSAEGYMWAPLLPIPNEILSEFLNIFGALLTYLVHLIAPLLLFSRSTYKIFFYWIFYSLFHFMTIFVGIMFSMNFLAWMMLLPIYKLPRIFK